MSKQTELDRLDQEAAERIRQAFFEARRQFRKTEQAFLRRALEAIASHREEILKAARGKPLPKGKVDYQRLYEILQQQPLTYEIIKAETGLNDSGVAQVITTLSLEYPVWNPAKGIYELLR
jgi:hypothetical protein